VGRPGEKLLIVRADHPPFGSKFSLGGGSSGRSSARHNRAQRSEKPTDLTYLALSWWACLARYGDFRDLSCRVNQADQCFSKQTRLVVAFSLYNWKANFPPKRRKRRFALADSPKLPKRPPQNTTPSKRRRKRKLFPAQRPVRTRTPLLQWALSVSPSLIIVEFGSTEQLVSRGFSFRHDSGEGGRWKREKEGQEAGMHT
jgi:hypothetical protein